MAVQFTLICDDCGGVIHASGKSARAARAEAQLQCNASCAGGVDRCASCRLEHGRRLNARLGASVATSHSAGQQR